MDNLDQAFEADGVMINSSLQWTRHKQGITKVIEYMKPRVSEKKGKL